MNGVIWTLVLFWLIPLTSGDLTVTCVVSDACVLPCTSSFHDIIHWHKEGKPDSIHTFYDNADQLELQDEDFKGRTSLFPDQLSQGNISLLLKDIQIRDEGEYTCYTATSSENKVQSVWLKAKAPVKQVDIQIINEELSCSVNKVYPQPKITWYRDDNSYNLTEELDEDEEHLFSVSSVLPQSVKDRNTYSCSISLGDEKENYIASLRKENVEISVGQNVTIHCLDPQKNDGSTTFTLTFQKSSPILIFSKDSQKPTTEQWRGKTVQFSLDGNVTINNLDSNYFAGDYTCESLTAQSRQLVITSVQIKSEGEVHIAAVIVPVVVVVVIGIIVICVRCIRSRRRRANHREFISVTRMSALSSEGSECESSSVIP